MKFEISDIREDFDQLSSSVLMHVNDRTRIYEASLEGFASYIAATPQVNLDNVRRYAQLIRKQFPYIYMMELSQRVTPAERTGLVRRMRTAGYADFEIHTFGYESDRKRHPVAEGVTTYPVVFIEPELPEAMDVLGLDLATTSATLDETVKRSMRAGRQMASRPFDMMEGGRSYLMFQPVVSQHQIEQATDVLSEPYYALMVVETKTLLPHWVQQREGLKASVWYRGVLPEQDQLLTSAQYENHDEFWLSWLFPTFEKSLQVNSGSQPFLLKIHYEVCWRDVDMMEIGIFSIMVIVTFLLASWFSIILYRKRVEQLTAHETLFNMANFDALTGLPNKNLLMDRVEQAIRHARRSNLRVALLYMDLDRFKAVNDNHGHKVGDLLLKRVVERIAVIVRSHDTLARLHGDEFVVLMSEVKHRRDVERLAGKIKALFNTSFTVYEESMMLDVSIGIALYPDDGMSGPVLLNLSDKRMYEDKRTGQELPAGGVDEVEEPI
ncbi:sensor domain-containing diguanylate cyclase [Solemya pervernicosa gill symbiont]|uniref:sensor domain-containing diguanylate cyclase n=1 Tax=Solemya pervernicosa gill symbiont TaxID=642797 RepID=UPI0015600AA8|nr:sensor domain-containing diguanylate cyclase [Solemya pervernicosa gill symbiont]